LRYSSEVPRSSPPPSPALAQAIEAGLDFLARCQMGNGSIQEPVADPLAALTRPTSLSPSERFHALGGADIWNTVNTLALFRRHGRDTRKLEAFLRPFLAPGTGLCYWSARAGFCAETTAAMARIATPRDRRALLAGIRQHALPRGRWASFILDGPGGYESYLTAPSVTAWILAALDADDPLVPPALGYLKELVATRPIWSGHPAFYGTPFYPAHLAARFLPKPSVLAYTLSTQGVSGGWGFGDPPKGPSGVLPTAMAIRTLRAFPPRPRVIRAIRRGVDWLARAQRRGGAFPLGPAPQALWYVGTIYSTCQAVAALAGEGDP
jgi:hypothetical protein